MLIFSFEFSANTPWEKNVRLPRSVLPLHYDLYLHPNLGMVSNNTSMTTIFGHKPLKQKKMEFSETILNKFNIVSF